MNERIRELAEQADEYANSLYSIHGESMKGHYQDVAMEKFAELIVQECVNVLHDNELHNRHISHVLREHFGVEK